MGNVHVALVTIADATTDVCVEVGDLGAAVALENGLERWSGHAERVFARLRAQQDRRFTFRSEEALRFMGKAKGYPDPDPEV